MTKQQRISALTEEVAEARALAVQANARLDFFVCELRNVCERAGLPVPSFGEPGVGVTSLRLVSGGAS